MKRSMLVLMIVPYIGVIRKTKMTVTSVMFLDGKTRMRKMTNKV